MKSEEEKKAEKEKAEKEKWSDKEKFRKYGSKLRHIVEKIEEIKRDDPGTKILVFCQWEVLKRKIAAAFHDFKLNAVSLEGSTGRKNLIIEKFKKKAD